MDSWQYLKSSLQTHYHYLTDEVTKFSSFLLSSTDSNGLASKLAAKFKASNKLIADTPEKSSSSKSPARKSAKVLVEDTPVRKEEKRTRTPVKV